MNVVFWGDRVCNVDYNPHDNPPKLGLVLENYMRQKYQEPYPSFWTTVVGPVPALDRNPNSFKHVLL